MGSTLATATHADKCGSKQPVAVPVAVKVRILVLHQWSWEVQHCFVATAMVA